MNPSAQDMVSEVPPRTPPWAGFTVHPAIPLRTDLPGTTPRCEAPYPPRVHRAHGQRRSRFDVA